MNGCLICIGGQDDEGIFAKHRMKGDPPDRISFKVSRFKHG